MAKATDNANLGSDESADVVTLSREEYDALLAARDAGPNPEPAFEEGPHLNDPDIRAAKRQQMRDAGLDHESGGITEDMRAILREKGDD